MLGFGILMLTWFAGISNAQERDGYVRIPVNVSLWPGASIGDAIAQQTGREVINVVSLNLLAGRAARLEGVELSGLWGRYTEDAYGLQAAGIANAVHGTLQGLQVAGLGNVAGENLRGLQVAGLGNIVGDDGLGLQASGLANMIGEDGQGVQAAGLFNIVGDEGRMIQAAGLFNVGGGMLQGVQASGLGNIAGEDMRGVQAAGLLNLGGEAFVGVQGSGLLNIGGEQVYGVQAAGLFNIAGEDLRGVQAAGLFNITGGTMRGAQISGLVNITPYSEGLQLGLVNISDENTGVPIGLVSYVRRIGLALDVWADETGFVHTALHSGSARVVNLVGVGARPFGDRYRWARMVGFGVNFDLAPRVQATLDVAALNLESSFFKAEGNLLNKLRLTAAYALSEQVTLFGGPTFNVFISDEHDGSDLAPWSVYDDEIGGTFVRMWPGFVAGLRVQIVPGR